MSAAEESDHPMVSLDVAYAVGEDAILRRLDQLASLRETINGGFDANQREHEELRQRWNLNLSEDDGLRLKLNALRRGFRA